MGEGRVKSCSSCKAEKPLTAFFKRSDCGRPFHFRSKCKACTMEAQQRWNSANGKVLADAHRFKNLRRKYGLSKEQYLHIMASQQGRCRTCRCEFSAKWGRKYPCVDHCHRTGTIRGILCRDCNTVLGLVSDSPEVLANMRTYLAGPATWAA